MAIDESMFPDTPQTPAPLFAYRALKGFVFGSPNDEEDGNKENSEVEVSGEQYAKSISNLTPQKRKRPGDCVSSPIKSILRPSGVPTPRTLHLQKDNVGVTFKDIRKSTSPKGKAGKRRQDTSKGSPFRRTSNGRTALGTGTRNEEFTRAASNAAAPKSSSVQPLTVDRLPSKPDSRRSIRVTPTSTVAKAAPFDIDAYKRSTENEMKKLVRYGQKMREYARKQDEENAKLKQALEECRRENERLRKAEENRAKFVISSSVTTQGRAEAKPERDSREERRISENNTVPTTARVSLGGFQAPKQAKSARNIGQRTPEQSIGRVREKWDANHGEDQEEGEELDRKKMRQASVRLPPDRVAAARERIKMKAAKRKASEMSQVDWAGL